MTQDALADDEPDSRWMTITELAESRQISTASASRLVRRRRWRRMRDNRGAVRVYVPVGEELPQDHPTDSQEDVPADAVLEVRAIVLAKDEVIAGHLAHIDTLKATLTKVEARADELQRQPGPMAFSWLVAPTATAAGRMNPIGAGQPADADGKARGAGPGSGWRGGGE
jgi:hypothetical protein